MAKIEKFEDLECWRDARSLCKIIYTLEGPIVKDWGIKDQLRRASLSIMNNTTEGFGRYSNLETIRFLDFAQSSACEVKSMIYLLEDLNYLSTEQTIELHEKVDGTKSKILGLIRYLRKK